MDPRGTDTVYLLVLFALIMIHGGGRFSLDHAVNTLVKKRFPTLMRDPRNLDGLPRVVIVGAGFGGISCAAALRRRCFGDFDRPGELSLISAACCTKWRLRHYRRETSPHPCANCSAMHSVFGCFWVRPRRRHSKAIVTIKEKRDSL